MTDSAAISLFVQAPGKPVPAPPRARPDAGDPSTGRTDNRGDSTADRTAAPIPLRRGALLSTENQLAAQQGEEPSGGETGKAPLAAQATSEQLTEEEKKKVQELQKRDREVRAHEQAHKTAGGGHAGHPSYKTVRGPDGRSYAVSGEVKIDTSPVPNNPDATIRKMEQVKRAALAPSNPSAQDRRVAAEAEAKIQAARQEKREEEAEELAKASAKNRGGAASQATPAGTSGAGPLNAGDTAIPLAATGSPLPARPGSLFNLVT